jgi:hypothetical protein
VVSQYDCASPVKPHTQKNDKLYKAAAGNTLAHTASKEAFHCSEQLLLCCGQCGQCAADSSQCGADSCQYWSSCCTASPRWRQGSCCSTAAAACILRAPSYQRCGLLYQTSKSDAYAVCYLGFGRLCSIVQHSKERQRQSYNDCGAASASLRVSHGVLKQWLSDLPNLCFSRGS